MKIGDLILRTFVVCLRELGEMDSLLTNPYQYTHGLPFSNEQVTVAVRRLVRNGDLARKGSGAQAEFRLTKRGEQRVRERMSRFLLEPIEWDGKWRMVIWDIAETRRETRDRLRRFLKSVGFGRLQLSIWITPFPAREILDTFLQNAKLTGSVMVVEAEYVSGMASEELADRVWGLSSLVRQYRLFAEECAGSNKPSQALKEQFQHCVVTDPFLPDGLLPYDIGRERAFRAYHQLLDISYKQHTGGKRTELRSIGRR